jgi:hypothetical protein
LCAAHSHGKTIKQTTFESLAWSGKGKVTRRERFLTEMDAVIPWRELLELIQPHYPKAGNGKESLVRADKVRCACQHAQDTSCHHVREHSR